MLAAGALALSGCANETPPEQPGAHTRAVLEDVFATTSQTGFGETFLDRLSDDVTFTATGTSPVAGQYHGKTEYREKVLSRLHDHLATPMRPQLDQMIVDGDWAAVRFHTEGVHGTNGSDASMQYCWVMRVAGDQIVDVIGLLRHREDGRALRLMVPDRGLIGSTCCRPERFGGPADGRV
ncbi:nuclear transport factor 2 family protein [Mycolicibacterium smegmatis]|uniref:nuclear transport factor 2 family protein n=1 Tax=Mycolicibacterium smegmatis TaxID=1772 RepID=UPI001EFC135E|nr:nuclear transport factor 2 family protein [Mycolicibacterium smegmatis]